MTVYGDAAASRAWRAGTTYPAGAVLVAAHTEVVGGAAGPLLVMQKRARGYFPRGEDWSYAYATPAARPLRQGRLDDCASCHALAQRDGVFVTRTAR